MKSRLTMCAYITAMLVTLAGLHSTRAQDSPQVHSQDGVKFVTGGVGTDERAALDAMSGQFNLKLSLAVNSGHFLGDAAVRIADMGGRTVLDAKTDGPLFYARLPAGTYRVTVTRNGKDSQETARLTDDGQTRLDFRWSGE